MAPRRRLISTLLAAAAAAGVALALGPRPASGQQQPPAGPGTAQPVAQSAAQRAPAGQAPPPGTPDVPGDLQRLSATLRSPSARQVERDDAAARLVSRQSVDADRLLQEVLANGIPAGKIAVARALLDDASPHDAFIGPLGEQLGGGEQRSVPLAEAAAQALAAYRQNQQAIDFLSSAAADLNLPGPVRVASIRAMGRVVDPAVAQALVRLVGAPPNERRDVRDAAGDALIDMTGLAENGRDPQRWAQWLQQSNPAAAPDAWRAELLAARLARTEKAARRLQSLVLDVKPRLFRQYQAATKEEKQPFLLDLLNSGEPDLRAIGTEFVKVAMQEHEDVAAPVRDRLVAMVGDPDVNVRLLTAQTLQYLNDPAALRALLTQLAQERDDGVRIAQIAAVAPIGDRAAVQPLLDLLRNQPSPAAALAVVRAVGTINRGLRSADPDLADQVAARLRAIIRQRGRNRPPEELRIAALDALAPLRDPAVLEMGRELLGEQSPAVRLAALRVLGELGDERAAALVSGVVANERRDPAVRAAALDALARTGGLAYYQTLFDYTQGRVEADPAVRAAAWQALRTALPRGTDEQLANTARLFRDDPDRHVVVAQALAERLRQRNNLNEWAIQLQNVAEDEQKLREPRHADAASHFEEVLDYWLKNNGAALTIDDLTRKVVLARLAAGQFQQATSFAQSAITRHGAAAQQVVGPLIKQGADQLRTDGKLANALALIDLALKMDPPLDPRYRTDLKQIKTDIESANPQAPNTGQPSSAQPNTGQPSTALPSTGQSNNPQ